MWLCNNYDNPHAAAEVEAVQQFFVKNMDVMHNVYPIVATYSLKQRGMDISTFTRRRVGTFTNSIRQGVEALCGDYNILSRSLELV